MPEPDSRGTASASQARRSACHSSRTACSRRLSRASGPRSTCSAAPSCSATSAVTRWLAVAVVASTGTSSPRASSVRAMSRYSGRKSWPQSETQCASSTTTRPGEPSAGRSSSRKRSLASCSGVVKSTSTAADSSASRMAWRSAVWSRRATRSPKRAAARSWSRISESSGLTSSVGPARRRRSRAVATK